jgi:hypothetical protein
LPAGGEWRCLWLSKVTNTQLRDGPWFAGSSHLREQGCVEEVDWPAPGSEDTELGVLMGPEVSHGEAKVYTGVQA